MCRIQQNKTTPYREMLTYKPLTNNSVNINSDVGIVIVMSSNVFAYVHLKRINPIFFYSYAVPQSLKKLEMFEGEQKGEQTDEAFWHYKARDPTRFPEHFVHQNVNWNRYRTTQSSPYRVVNIY